MAIRRIHQTTLECACGRSRHLTARTEAQLIRRILAAGWDAKAEGRYLGPQRLDARCPACRAREAAVPQLR